MDGAYFHILNRGIDKQNIFFNDNDYLRFILGIYRFNNKSGAIRVSKKKNAFAVLPKLDEKLVEVLKWTLMPNHYHLFVKENIPGGAVEFAKRIGNGYTKYINIKNKRSGYLFQNAARVIEVTNESHFLYLPIYIELNVLDLVESNWKENGIRNKERAKKFLREYKWSSYRDFKVDGNSTDIANTKLFYETFNTDADKYTEEIDQWIEDDTFTQNSSTWQVDEFNIL